jgi:signal transduction histidine kinase
MPTSKQPEVLVKSVFLRPAQMMALVLAVLLTLALVSLGLFAWFDFERVEAIRSRVNRTRLLQESQMLLKDAEVRASSGAAGTPGPTLAAVKARLAEIPTLGAPVGQITRERLARLETLLTGAREPALLEAADLVNRMLDREIAVETQLLDDVHAHTRLAWRLALVALVAFPALLMLALWTIRQRVLRPVGDLKNFLSRLSNGDFTPVSVAGIDPLLLPLFENYNQMVLRLEQLEDRNRSRTLSLQQEVRAVTRTLLRQQQTLARAERLATAGEVSATFAHELRNPIASIQVTLVNLRREFADPELVARIELVIAELQRMTRLLNSMLQQSSHVPEVPRTVGVDPMLQELAALIRYQVPPQIRLLVDAPADLHWRLPEDGMRQAVLNLVLNSVEAIGHREGTVTIRGEARDDGLRLAVLDDGPGFSDAILAGGTRPFLTFRESGTGLGLAIVKRFVRDLGGEFHIANRTPTGASVILTIPSNGHDD